MSSTCRRSSVFIGRPIPRVKLPEFNYLYTQLFNLKEGANLEKIKVSGGRSGKGYSYSSAKTEAVDARWQATAAVRRPYSNASPLRHPAAA